jgi:hypothetical protein
LKPPLLRSQITTLLSEGIDPDAIAIQTGADISYVMRLKRHDGIPEPHAKRQKPASTPSPRQQRCAALKAEIETLILRILGPSEA